MFNSIHNTKHLSTYATSIRVKEIPNFLRKNIITNKKFITDFHKFKLSFHTGNLLGWFYQNLSFRFDIFTMVNLFYRLILKSAYM